LNSGGEEMSKSLGNYTTAQALLDQHPLTGRALRLLLLQTHYRKTMELNTEVMDQARRAIERLDAMARKATAAGIALDGSERDASTISAFTEVRDDDLGTPEGVAIVFETVRRANSSLDAAHVDAAALAATAIDLAGALGLRIDDGTATEANDHDEIDALVAARTVARETKDFAEADRIREELTSRGITLEDTPNGPVWRRG
ncbi:MAG: cysteine--tRNA ligase, partial [Actinomycetia bacterium]|nr:cysteine--tRNA ligase [Actinomycetes bacterium]